MPQYQRRVGVPFFPKSNPFQPVIRYPVTEDVIEMLEEKARSCTIKLKPKWLGQSYWTTIGSTIWAPRPWVWDYDRDVLAHEAVHVIQYEKYGWLVMALFYLGPTWYILAAFAALSFFDLLSTYLLWVALALLPLSAFLAWGRWYIERVAYLVSQAYGDRIESNVRSLWSAGYGWCWPRTWMRAWFAQHTRVSPKYDRSPSGS